MLRSKIIEADVLNEPGRSTEAKALIKDKAFDAQGRPRLTDIALVVYAHATVAQGNISEGEQLLEAAVRSPQRVGTFHIALAELLLEEKKDVERATKLIEDAIETWRPQGPYRAWISLHRSAAHAWALAVSGRRDEAEKELQRVSTSLPSAANRDAAHLQRLIGETRVALGDLDGARAAFANAAERDPQGYNGKKAWDKLEMLPK
jgi:tetratricopeptide (TPR) repeat protein